MRIKVPSNLRMIFVGFPKLNSTEQSILARNKKKCYNTMRGNSRGNGRERKREEGCKTKGGRAVDVLFDLRIQRMCVFYASQILFKTNNVFSLSASFQVL